MLARPNRLKKKEEFQRVFKKGKGAKEDFLLLKFAPNNTKENRYGVIVSQKVSKKATARNKIKRRIRAVIGQKTAKLKKGVDVVFVALPGLETISFQGIEGAIDRLFKKLKLFQNADKDSSSGS